MSAETPPGGTPPPPPGGPPPGWYEDPQDGGGQRYWDGSTWTAQTRAGSGGAASPPPSGPPAPGGAPGQGNVVYVQSPGNGMAVAALVLGIIGVVFGIIPLTFFIAWVLGILALVLGLLARGRAKKKPEVGRKTMATWGAVLGAIAIALGVVGAVIVNDVFEDTGKELQELGECIEEADKPEEIDAC